MPVIELDNLTQDYATGFWRKRHVRALDGLSLQVGAGEVFGLLGPNGAGKTTTFKILMDLIRPTAGTARILSLPVGSVQARQRIGYLPEQPYFYDYLTAREFLLYCAALCDLPKSLATTRTDALLSQLGLADSAAKPLRKFSKGMLQRLGIAQALIHDPEVLFLDEPMSGLDPLGRREVRDLIVAQRAEGKTVFFSSHILTDVEAMCDRVAILNRGRLVESGKLSEILESRGNEAEAVISGVSEATLAELRSFAISVSPTPEGARVRLSGDATIARLVSVTQQAGGHIVSINPVRESLEEFFVREVSGTD